MFYTESFLNESTYLGKGHIWHFKMSWDRKECLFCCVCESKFDRGKEEIEAVLKRWFHQTLPYSLEKGAVGIQRELNRFAVWLAKWSGAEKDVKAPVLYLYAWGKLYSSETNEAVFTECRGHRGVILAAKTNSEKRLKKSDVFAKTPEETANRLKRDMLAAMSRGVLKQGYFMIWEEKDDFQTG